MSIGIAAASGAIELIETARKQGWLDNLTSAVRKKHRVILLGATGAGKTNFLNSLTEAMPVAIDVMNRTEIAKKSRLKIHKYPFVFTDTPGQEMHKSRRIKAIREAMTGKLAGIINVVSYGYHEYRIGSKSAFDNEGKISESFLSEQRQKEIDAVHEWTPLLGGKEVANWLITVVTKADLWWHERDKVMQYYQAGAYYEALDSAKVLHPIVMEYASVFKKFFGTGPMSGEFQDSDRSRAKAHLIEELLASIGKVNRA